MAEYIEIGGKKIPKKYAIAAGVVGGGALLFMLMQNGDTDTVAVPTAITGYPEIDTGTQPSTGGAGMDYSDLTDLFSDFRDNQQNQIDAQNDYINNLIEQLNQVKDKVEHPDVEPQTIWTDKQYMSAVNVLPGAAPPSTSSLNDSNIQQAINNAILSGAGATLINQLNDARDSKIASTGRNTATQNSYYDKNTDYSTLINAAVSQGASQSVINNLTAMRNAKIIGEYGGTDPKPLAVSGSGSTSTSNTKSSSSSSSNKSTSSGSSSSSTSSGTWKTDNSSGVMSRVNTSTGQRQTYSKNQGWH